MNTFKYLAFVILYTTLFSSCSSIYKSNFSSLLKSSNFILVETAVGNSYEDARSKVISQLSQDIIVSSKSSFKSKSILINNRYKKIASNRIQLKSAGYFKSLTFSKVRKVSDSKYKVSAGLSKLSIKSTIQFLNIILKQNTKNISYFLLNEELNKVTFLNALLFYSKNHNINIDLNIGNILNQSIQYQKYINFRIANSATLVFNILPKLAHVIKLSINSKIYQNSNSIIYLQPGTYEYSIKASTYKQYKKLITLHKASSTTVSVLLQKKLPSNVLANLNIVNNTKYFKHNSNTSLKSNINYLLRNYQIKILNNQLLNKKVNIIFGEVTSHEFGGELLSSLPLTVNLVNNGDVVASKTSNISIIDNIVSQNLILSNLDKLLERLTYGETIVNFSK